MKRFLVILGLALACLCTSGQVGNAQFACPTPPDCTGDPFIGPLTAQFTFYRPPNGEPCVVTVHYCFRLACGVFRDVFITGWEFDDPACMGVLNPTDLVDRSMKAIWEKNPWDPQNPPDIPLCPGKSYNWRVFTAGCYQSVAPGGGGGSGTTFSVATIYYCYATAQCFGLYEVCRDPVTRELKATKVDGFSATECPPHPYNGRPCDHYCPPD